MAVAVTVTGGDAKVFNPSRRKSRRRALDVLYQADLRDLDPLQVLAVVLSTQVMSFCSNKGIGTTVRCTVVAADSVSLEQSAAVDCGGCRPTVSLPCCR